MVIRKAGVFAVALLTIFSVLVMTPQPASATQLHAPFSASNGMSGNYHVIDDHVDYSRPVGLIVQLHGDGAGEFQNYPNGHGKLTQIQPVAQRHNMVLLSARTPSFEEGDHTWWAGNGTAKSDYLAELINAVAYGNYPVDRSRVWFSGYSGGAEQLTYHFLSRHLGLVSGGGALMTGGGGARGLLNSPLQTRPNFRLHWLTGTDDRTTSFCGTCAAATGIAHYVPQGFIRSTIDVRPGYDHYELQGLEAGVLDQLISGAI